MALQILEKVEAAIAASNDQALGHLEQLLDFFKGLSARHSNHLIPETRV